MKNYTFSFSNFYAFQRVTGEDPLARKVPLDNPTTDPNTLPSKLNRNIVATQLSGHWFDKKVEALVFGKYYTYLNSSNNFRQEGSSIIFPPITKSGEEFGFGAGLKLSLDEDRF